jgi:hypothetical protein
MSQIITTGTHPKDMWPGIKAHFGQEYDKHQEEWPDLFDQDTSEKGYEEVVLTVGMGFPQVKPETESISYDTTSQGFTKRFTHVPYALGYMVSQEAQRDNQYDAVVKRRTPDLAFSMRQGHETVCANVYNRAFTSGYTGGDGVVLASASHPTVFGNQSNLLTAADLSEASLEDGVISVMTAVDDRGRKISLQATSLHIHPNSWFEATRILKSVLQNDTAMNAVNALRVTNALPNGIKMNHYFDDTDAWFIRTNARNSMKHFQRDPIEFGQDGVFDTKVVKYAAYERFSASWADWRGVYCNAGA